MEDKEVEIVNAQRAVLYTKEELFEDIQTTVEEYVEDTPEDEKDRRDFRHKLKVLQSIFGLHLPSYDSKKDNMDDIKEALEVYVDGNEFLFGYTFFLSSNTNFDYSWNYLRKQMDKYVNFFSEAYKFISYVIVDINTMKIDLRGNKDLHIEFNELFDVKFIDDKPFVKTVVNWENFYQINKVKYGYYISAKIGNTTLLTCYRKYSDELNPFLNGVMQVLAAWKELTEKKDKI